MAGTVDGFSTATEMLAALRARDVSAVELLDLHLRRIEGYDAVVNAVVIRDFERAREAARAGTDPFAEARERGIECTAADFIALHDRREQYRKAWRRFFREWDVLLAPVATFLAPAHSTLPVHQRTTNINGQATTMRFAMVYASLPIVSGLPATALPIGLSRVGLPICVQAVGPFLEDRTPIRFAKLVSEQLGGSRPPPGYD